jgi:hypothetical protein
VAVSTIASNPKRTTDQKAPERKFRGFFFAWFLMSAAAAADQRRAGEN